MFFNCKVLPSTFNTSDIRQARAMLHSWEKDGLENAEAKFWENFNEKHHLHTIPTSFRDIIRGKIEFIGAVRGDGDRIYLKYLTWLRKLAPDLVNDKKWNDVVAQNLLLEQQRILPLPMIWCEGKTDIKHLKSALEWLSKNGTNYKLELEFKEDLNQQTQGSNELLKMCKQFSKARQIQPIIAIFDRDESGIIKNVHADSNGFKNWGNGVYSFAIPIPKHRSDKDGVCIELYYKDTEIQRKDKNGRRLFLSSEFNTTSDRHNSLNLFAHRSKSERESKQLKIIDDSVFDMDHINVALSKDNFANYILEDTENFNDFDFEEFQRIFMIIRKILIDHTENNI